MAKIILLSLFLWCYVQSWAQDLETEDLFYRFDTPENQYEQLLQYYSRPLILNHTNPYELRRLGLLSQTQIRAFFQHLKTYGKLISIYELQAIEGFDRETIYSLLPFVSIDRYANPVYNYTLLKRLLSSKAHTLLIRYDKVSSNLVDKNYLGDPYRLYVRYRNYLAEDFSIGFTLEKDIGEQLISRNKQRLQVFDFQSFHIAKYNFYKVKMLLLGDYTLNIGQGLIFGTGFFVGKSSQSVAGVLRNRPVLNPYTAVTEAGFLRGLATTLNLKPFKINLFYSNQNLDAKRSLAGLHRTESEITKRDVLAEQLFGYHIKYESSRLRIGQTSSYVELSDTLQNLNSNQFLNLGTDFTWSWRNIWVGGEWALSSSKWSSAWVLSAIMTLSKSLDLSLLYRNYEADYQGFYARAFAELKTANEKANYLGLRFRPTKYWLFNAYLDVFSFAWPAKSGYDVLLRGQHKTKKHYLFFQYRLKHNQTEFKTSSPFSRLEDTQTEQVRLHLEFKPDPSLTWKTRLQASKYTTESLKAKYGYLLSQTFILKFGNFKLNGTAHFFQTEHSQTRQYIYENDVLYAFSFPSFGGLGSRLYTVLAVKVNRQVSFYLKYAKTIMLTEEPDEDTEERDYWRAMLRLRF